ncbi:hypothetical protein AEQ27_01965 [Frigoribacterium sp. RIT-PI-h]|nr:hypothetical protein AEQ27_01965 [Frigoribacterium sp. RIT-PI-h]
MWPTPAEVPPAAFANSGLTVVAFRPPSAEPSGAGFLYGYEVDPVAPAGATSTVLTFIDTAPRAADASSVLPRDPTTGQPLAVWAYPADPLLPALAGATYPDRVADALAALGVVVTDPRLSVAAHRPGKRAVIRLDAAETTVFLKVVRPVRGGPGVALREAARAQGLRRPPCSRRDRTACAAAGASPGCRPGSASSSSPTTPGSSSRWSTWGRASPGSR